jgi:hypothetical protein
MHRIIRNLHLFKFEDVVTICRVNPFWDDPETISWRGLSRFCVSKLGLRQ